MASIYQRARPRRFDEVVGQEHVKDVLLAALRLGRVGHAYLFSGPRGVGKTTTARLLAMAVNCDAEAAERPCGACESCLLVQRGDHPDVIELDAASNNSVDDVRDLREKVRLASLRGGRRVWVLDEAHMLSRAAANALLKTLEEPPPGLVFVLATTEPEKLPPTVLSRCQHFRFRRLSVEQIRSKLTRLAAEAGVEADEDALSLVARAADGAMRDAESLLERLLVEGERVTLERAEAALGLPPGERLLQLAVALADGAWDALLGEAGAPYRDGLAPR
ncbi:MAG: DNA polymerase III subunit gamma/tau, partial [Trueperaceae bacterium]|nr:DNA polymerase III subunit gamma/tau [Trueperaceae bacterium]